MKNRMRCFAVVALCLCFALPSSSWAHEGPPYDRTDHKIAHAVEDAYHTVKTATQVIVYGVANQVVQETMSYYEWLDSGMEYISDKLDYVADVYFPATGSATDHEPIVPTPNPAESQCATGALSPDHPTCKALGLP